MKCKHTGKDIVSPLDKLNESESSVGVQPIVRSWFNKISDKVTVGCFALWLHPHFHRWPPLSEWQWTEYVVVILAAVAVVIGVWFIIGQIKFYREIGK